MKLRKEQFKKILKECILELVEEGAFDKIVTESINSSQASNNRIPANDLVGGTGGYNNPMEQSNNERIRQIAQQAAALTSGNDSKRANMLTAIFEDTAKTTWQKTMAAEGGGGGMFIGEAVDPESEKIEQAELEALTGGKGTNHWAALAFGKYEK